MPKNPNLGPRALATVVAVAVVGLVALISAGAFLVSIKGTDAGTVCVVREGGPFDGRDIKEVRQPGEGPKPIGPFNKQDCLPTTERDTNDVLEGAPQFPTRDSVQVIADGQVLFNLTTDEGKIDTFYRKFGRRKWGGEDISTEQGWLNFLRQRFSPVVLDAQRQVIGTYECSDLNNLCIYVQNPDAALRPGETARPRDENNNQNLAEAQGRVADAIRQKLRAAFGDDYFENVRYQNLRIRFEAEVQRRITEAQSLRTQAANAALDAQRKKAEAKGEADRRVEEANGERRAAFQKAQAYRLNPNQRIIDRIRAFCGAEGCDPQVFGGDAGDVIASLGQGGGGRAAP